MTFKMPLLKITFMPLSFIPFKNLASKFKIFFKNANNFLFDMWISNLLFIFKFKLFCDPVLDLGIFKICNSQSDQYYS